MASAITPLANITLSTSAATVTFNSLSQVYRDIMLVCSALATTSGQAGRLRLNNDSGANYTFVQMYGTGSSYGSSGSSGATEMYGLPAEPTAITNSIFNILDYSATNKHKTALIRDNNPDSITRGMAIRWANTSAITSLNLFMTSGNFAAGTTFALYGVSA